jgi:hypothetical protein
MILQLRAITYGKSLVHRRAYSARKLTFKINALTDFWCVGCIIVQVLAEPRLYVRPHRACATVSISERLMKAVRIFKLERVRRVAGPSGR